MIEMVSMDGFINPLNSPFQEAPRPGPLSSLTFTGSQSSRDHPLESGFTEKDLCITGEKWFASGESKIFRISGN
jgi:hypothetical protein